MQFTKQQLEELKDAIEKDHGVVLDDKELNQIAIRLIEIYEAVYAKE